MKKEKVIISSLIPNVLDSYTIGTGITAQNKSIKRKLYDISVLLSQHHMR